MDSDLEDSKAIGMTQFTIPPPATGDKPLHVNIISDKDGRTEVALCARQIAAFQREQKDPLESASLFKLDINTLDVVLEGGLLETRERHGLMRVFSQATVSRYASRSFYVPSIVQETLRASRVPTMAN